jgi:hypothetical protein
MNDSAASIISKVWSFCNVGKYKEKDSDIIEKRQDGTSSIRFRTVPADKASVYMKGLIDSWQECISEAKEFRKYKLNIQCNDLGFIL